MWITHMLINSDTQVIHIVIHFLKKLWIIFPKGIDNSNLERINDDELYQSINLVHIITTIIHGLDNPVDVVMIVGFYCYIQSNLFKAVSDL